MHPIDAAAAEISAAATPADVDDARAFLHMRRRHGYASAMLSPAAGRLITRHRINRHLGTIARRIVADHHTEPWFEMRHREARERIHARWRAGQMTDAQHEDRLASVRRLRDERAAVDARYRYRGLSQHEKTRERLAFRAARPRLPLRSH